MKLDVLYSTPIDLEKKLHLVDAALDPDEIADEATAVILNRIRTRFLAESGPDGPFKPSKAGLLRKAGGYTTRNGKRYTGTGTLFETGTLFHSIQAVRLEEGARSIMTDVPYARYAEADGVRKFLGFNAEDESVVKALIRLRLEKAGI